MSTKLIRIVAHALGKNVYDVDVSNDCIYIWDEWDNPNVSILPFEFNLIKRK